jgi:TonB family protein
MHNWLGVTLACVVLSAPVEIHAAQVPPIPDNPLRAQTFLGFNPKKRCPDLRIADGGTMAVVVFWLPRSGIPSKIFIKSPSGSNALDSAAIGCVSRLRFAPATTVGDGESIDSWQQIAFRWANQGNADETRAMTSQNPLSGSSQASESIAGAPAQTAANARQDDSGGQANSVTVHVCVDETGRLEQEPTIVRSSGIASLDQAAVRIAASGCAQLAIKFDMK